MLEAEGAMTAAARMLAPGTPAYDVQRLIDHASAAELDDAVRLLWAGFAEGRISDADAEFLAERAHAKRPPRPNGNGLQTLDASAAPALCAAIAPKPQPKPPPAKPEADRTRRRRLGTNLVPPNVRQYYTAGELAVLSILVLNLRHSVCNVRISEFARRSGLHRRNVQKALRIAVECRHIAVIDHSQHGL